MERNILVNQSSVVKHRCPREKTRECLKLTGSQISLTSRSQKSAPQSPSSWWKSRPCSAYPCYNTYVQCQSKWKRPMSADDIGETRMVPNRSKLYNSNLLAPSSAEGVLTIPEVDPNFRHCYSSMSSNLLRSLIRNPWNSDCSESVSSDLSNSEKSLTCLIREVTGENSNGTDEGGKTSINPGSEGSGSGNGKSEKTRGPEIKRDKEVPDNGKTANGDSRDLKFQRWFNNPNRDEKTVKFYGGESEEGEEPEACKDEDLPAPVYDPENFASPKRGTEKFREEEGNPGGNPKSDYEIFRPNSDEDICDYRRENSVEPRPEKFSENPSPSGCPFSCCDAAECPPKYSPESKTEIAEPEKQEKEETESVTEKTLENIEEAIKDSTYDEIVTIINVLEREETNSLLKRETDEQRISEIRNSEQLKDIYSYLDEIEKSSQETINVVKMENGGTNPQAPLSSLPRLEELLKKNVVELAHEVLSLKLQIEDQSRGIKLLQNTIADMKEASKISKSNHEDELFKVNNDAEVAVQRHQKFIKQLLEEKKALNEKVGKLVEDLKSGEDRYQRNLKTIEQRHAIEIQRVKETQAVAEKLKREKWIDMKTQKIKEMTVKGLEPELSRMAARQQQELADQRALHRSELEAVELRATRRTTELLEELRSELSKDKEETILKETNALRAKLEKQFEEERSKLEHELRKLREERRREKEILESKEAQMMDSYAEMKRALEREKEREKQKIILEYQEQMEGLKRRHQGELKSLRDTLEIEKEAWVNNYKKQQNAKFMEREAELHHRYKKERDRDIELVIERLESEATHAEQEMNQASEAKIKKIREKFDKEIKEMEATEGVLKSKLSDAKTQLLKKDDEIAELNSQIHHYQSDVTHLKKLCEEMSAERGNLKEVIAKEFELQLAQVEKEREELRNHIATMKTNHILELAKKEQLAIQAKAEAQKELNQVYNRVKMTVSKKEEALEVLREQHKTVLERNSHLEKMLENQRRNLLLKYGMRKCVDDFPNAGENDANARAVEENVLESGLKPQPNYRMFWNKALRSASLI